MCSSASVWFPLSSNMVPFSLLLFLICVFKISLLTHAVYTTLKESVKDGFVIQNEAEERDEVKM